ncbi:MAG: hypothetical protein M3N54_05645 [Acidobacteriota bacterium]|nr:hypothetical protein [Acidobacteriota bacterium]
MATLATFFKRSEAMAGNAERSFPIRAESDPFRLRALPNDNIYFYSKRIDNSRVIRQADPGARGECWSAVGAAGVILMIGASVIAPHVASVLEGYKLEALKQERQSLVNQKRELEVREAGLLSPQRLNDLAKARNLTSPAADQIVHLDNPSMDGTFARNETPQASGLARAQ